MTLEVIEEMIQDIEKSGNSLSNARSLASLYILKLMKENRFKTLLRASDSVERELNDILPTYNYYVDTKRRYQRKEIDSTLVLEALKDVCQEIKEFLLMLYSCTDMQEERNELTNMLRELNTKLE